MTGEVIGLSGDATAIALLNWCFVKLPSEHLSLHPQVIVISLNWSWGKKTLAFTNDDVPRRLITTGNSCETEWLML